MTKRRPGRPVGPDLLAYASGYGYRLRRETNDRNGYVLIHGKTGTSITVPKAVRNGGARIQNWQALIRRGAKGEL